MINLIFGIFFGKYLTFIIYTKEEKPTPNAVPKGLEADVLGILAVTYKGERKQ